jgi:hypothetical protein
MFFERLVAYRSMFWFATWACSKSLHMEYQAARSDFGRF